jgi:SAM-dependent methyltransferase
MIEAAVAGSKVVSLSEHQRMGNKPNSLTTLAVEQVHEKQRHLALDLGAGDGRDTRYLCEHGFNMVFAVDPKKHDSLLKLRGKNVVYEERTAQQFLKVGTKTPAQFDNFNLVVCVNVLFFMSKREQHELLRRMYETLRLGGIMAFNLLGQEDQWAEEEHWSGRFFTREEIMVVKQLFQPISGIGYRENQRDGTLEDGAPHYWHLHHFICRKTD